MKRLLLFAILAGLFITPSVFADSIVGTGGNDWRSWIAGNVNENTFPYWDHSSNDIGNKNIGYYLTNTGHFTGSSDGPGAIPFWGSSYTPDTAGGAADPNFYFTKTASPSTASLKLEFGTNASVNEFGWYDTTDVSKTRYPIFYGSDTPIATATFDPTNTYGFYIKVNGETFYTQAGDGDQHFAVFMEPDGTYWIGMEDLTQTIDFDYQDMVVRITTIPEPATMLLLGSGLIGLAGFARRRFKK